MSRRLICVVVASLLFAACGDEDETAESAATATPTATAEETAEPTAEPTEEANTTDCQAGGWAIYISGDSGVSCKEAKKIQAQFLDGKKVPTGWDCAVAACTKVEDDGTVRDFYWKAG